MSSVDPSDEILASLRQGVSAGRLAHAYLIVAPPRGAGEKLAQALLGLVLCSDRARRPCGVCDGCKRLAVGHHPDVFKLEPESKARQIVIGDKDEIGVRDLIHFIAMSPYMAEYKAGVIVHAECMNKAAQNALLKTLEEPSAHSLLLLLTDAPQDLQPTVISRCQRILLPAGDARPAGPWEDGLAAILRAGAPDGVRQAAARAAHLKALLDAEKKRIEKAEPMPEANDTDKNQRERAEKIWAARVSAKYRAAREDVFRYIQCWHRDLLLTRLGVEEGGRYFPEERAIIAVQAAARTVPDAIAAVARVETVLDRLDRYINEELVMELDLP